MFIIGGVVLGIGMLVGWNQWRGSILTTQLEASTVYESLLGEVADGDLEAAQTAASDLYDNYSKTTYSSQARLAMARLYMDKGRDEDAADALRGLLNDDVSVEIRLLGKLRLAKILLYQDKAQEVVDLLSGETDTAFAARFGEALGDAYVMLGQFDAANNAYAIAVADDPNLPTVDRILVQMKINDMPEPGKVAAVDESLKSEQSDGADESPEMAADESGEAAQ